MLHYKSQKQLIQSTEKTYGAVKIRITRIVQTGSV